tara:strand:- start:243 stop:515 length:273 start_codon:yes stop_codon:yes gene_type:complete
MWTKIIKNVFAKNKLPSHLGRWCHPGVEGCTYAAVEKKIDFANLDNSIPKNIISQEELSYSVIANAHGMNSNLTNEILSQYLILDSYYKL